MSEPATRVTYIAEGQCGDRTMECPTPEHARYDAEGLAEYGNFRLPIARILKHTLTVEEVPIPAKASRSPAGGAK